MSTLSRLIAALVVVVVLAGAVYGNWSDSFNDGEFDLTTWQFLSYPAVTGTFTQTIKPGADGNDYLALAETTSVADAGSAFSAGFGSDETFTDVRVGAVVNVAGDASYNFHALVGRTSYIVDDGSLSGAPGMIADCYALLLNWEDGPANFRIELQKVVQLSNIMRTDFEVVVPNPANMRSYYAELDIVGSGPVYVTGSLYEYKGGPLVAQTPTMIDTNGNDPWEDEGVRDAVFASGLSAISGYHEDPEPAGYYTTFDDVSAVSDGPAAVVLSPANGATGVSIVPTLSWVEASFATGRQLWFGKPGNLQLVDPAPEGTTYAAGLLEPGQTYQWRVDEVGPAGTVTGYTWQFTTGQGLVVDDFESYANNAQIGATWVDNIEGEGLDYTFVDTGVIYQGAKAMRLEVQNQYEPYITEATRTFAEPQDWTVGGADMLTLVFRGQFSDDGNYGRNVEQPLYLKVEDDAGNEATATLPAYVVQSEFWHSWNIPLADITAAGVDLATVKKLTIGVGDGTDSGQSVDFPPDVDVIYVDYIRLSVLP